MIVAIIALVMALGGTSYAALSIPKNSVGSKQLKKNAVTTKKIKKGAVTAAKINPTGLTVPNSTKLGGVSTSGYQRSTLPSGATETSVWNLEGTEPSNLGNFISLHVPLSAAIPSSNVRFISDTSSFTTQCPGFGRAAAGFFCFYEGGHSGTVGFGSPYYLKGQHVTQEGVGPDGATIWATTTGSGLAFADGTWAVTAP
jgi:hypothetical protein